MPYLRPNLIAQPLFQNWYAWPFLLSPGTSGLNIRNRHLRIMDSFLKSPMIHAMACKNPKMLGGPFMDIPPARAAVVDALYRKTLDEAKPLLEFAEALSALNQLLRDEAKGLCIEGLYAELPPLLKGYVELFYDLRHQPGFRLIEGLLYHSPFYRPDFQSISLSLVESDDRPFVLSTPVLEDETKIHLPIAFADPRLDELFKAKQKRCSPAELGALLGVPAEKQALFDGFFQEEPLERRADYDGKGARVRYFGHACILLETAKVRILTDPVVSYCYPADVKRYTDRDLPDHIDYVLITHNHQDHVLIESLLKLRHKIGSVVIPAGRSTGLQDPSLKLMLEQLGFRSILTLDECQTLELGDVSLTGIPFLGEHCDLNIQSKIAHLLRIGSHSMLFAADACNLSPELYRHVQRVVGKIDALFLGMECDGAPLSWLYGPLFDGEIPREMDASRRLTGSNFERARALVEAFGFKEVFVYAMGMEPWLKYIMAYHYTPESDPIVASNKLIAWCRSQGIGARRLFGEHELELTGT